MKRIILLFVLLFCGVLLIGCSLGNKDIKNITEFYENMDDVSNQKEAFYENVSNKITNDLEKSTFTGDYFAVSSVDVIAGLYYSIINMHAITPKLVKADITKEKDVYTIKDGESVCKLKFDNKSQSSSLDIYEKDNLTNIVETIRVKDKQYAYQLVIKNETNDYTVFQFLFDDKNGRISVETNALNRPKSIYNNVKAIDSTFANAGTRVYKLENGNYQFTGTLNGPIYENKKVTNFTIDSGLKTEYMLGEGFNITNIKIKVTYEDNTTAIISVDQSMIVGNVPNTSTLGTVNFKLSYKTIEKSFSYQVIEGNTTHVTKLYNSYKSFYDSLAINENSFILKNTINNALKANDKKDAFNFFSNNVTSNALGMWSHFNLLNESIWAIKAHQEGDLGTLVFPDSTNEYDKYAYCHYNDAENVYNVGYWSRKNLNYAYWFESTISYDIESDSLKADIYCGINDERLYRAHIEYQKVEDSYAAFVYYPQSEFKDKGKYNSMHFFFNGVNGRVVENRWVNMPESIYMKNLGTDYVIEGDLVLTINNNGITVNYVDNLKSEANNFLNSFIDNNSSYDNSIEDTYLKKIKSMDEEGLLYPEDFSLNDYFIRFIMSYKNDYDKKTFTFEEDGDVVKVVDLPDGTKFTFLEGTDQESIYTIKYLSNKLLIEYISNWEYFRAELIKQGSTYYVQITKDDFYINDKPTYQYVQCKYIDINNIILSNSSNRLTIPDEIYNDIPTGFTQNGDLQFSLINNAYTYKEAIRVYFCPNNDEDDFIMMTDLDGYIILPSIKNTNFLGWYDDDDILIGKAGNKVKINYPITLSAYYRN